MICRIRTKTNRDKTVGTMANSNDTKKPSAEATYVLDQQVGFLLRRVQQRHLAIFFRHIPDMTSTQFAALAKLCELNSVSQNELGRRVAMDVATIKGVVDRLRAGGFARTEKDPLDQRRLLVRPTAAGRRAFRKYASAALDVTAETLEPLSQKEADKLLAILAKLT